MARHVVLGGAGFIGRHVALALLRRGDRVLLAARHAPIFPVVDHEAGKLGFLPLDMVDADWTAILQDGDIVHHYAWSTVPKTANDDPLADLDVNLRGTLRLLDALRRQRDTRLLFASSGGTVYGHAGPAPIPETHPLDPVTAYGVSKVAVEKYIGFYRAMHGLDGRIARIANPYGAGQDPQRRQGAVSVFLRRALADDPIEIWGDGSVVRDYVHIADVVRGLLALADLDPAALPARPIFNVGSGSGSSLNDLLDIIGRCVGRALDVRRLPGRQFDVPWNVLDVTLARAVLGWAPSLPIAEGISLALRDHMALGTTYSTMPASTGPASPMPASTVAASPDAEPAGRPPAAAAN